MPYATTSTTSRLSGRRRPCRPAGPMADTSFESLADSLLAALEEGIGDHADAELQGGVLTVEGEGGVWHYTFDEVSGQWRDTRGDADLLKTLSAELGLALAWRAP